MNSSEFKSDIRSFDEADTWNTGRYIVYPCENRKHDFWYAADHTVALQTDNLMKALAFIRKNTDRIHHYKLYDRKLVTFDRKRIMRAAMMEEEGREVKL
ncbi:hypothetical protein Osc1_10800 [Hominimerdicola sp. 21CYCFAH17_S]